MGKNLLFSLILIYILTGLSAQAQPDPSTGTILIMDSVYMKSLDRYRTIRIYLPPDYSDNQDSYPVLYMHDAQNLFDPSTSYAGEWEVDETLDSLYHQTGFGIIVVGIDNGGEIRAEEYSPWVNHQYYDTLKAEGAEYITFIADQLKPMIDSTYRTKVGPEFTGIMGSSLGGFISHYAVFSRPEVFGLGGIFSPSYWFSEQVYYTTAKAGNTEKIKVYILQGGNEFEGMARNTEWMVKMLDTKQFSRKRMKYVYVEEGTHSEKFWKHHVAEAVMFLYSVKRKK